MKVLCGSLLEKPPLASLRSLKSLQWKTPKRTRKEAPNSGQTDDCKRGLSYSAAFLAAEFITKKINAINNGLSDNFFNRTFERCKLILKSKTSGRNKVKTLQTAALTMHIASFSFAVWSTWQVRKSGDGRMNWIFASSIYKCALWETTTPRGVEWAAMRPTRDNRIAGERRFWRDWRI